MHLHDRAGTLASMYIYKAVFWHADISAVSARIEMGLAWNEICVFEDHVYFYKPIVPTVDWQECLDNEGVRSH